MWWKKVWTAVKILLINAEDRGGSCLFVAINAALGKHSKIDSLSQPMSQRERFAFFEVRALRSVHPGPYTLAMIPTKETPAGRLMRKEPALDYPSPLGTFSIDCCTLSVIFDTSGNRLEQYRRSSNNRLLSRSIAPLPTYPPPSLLRRGSRTAVV